MKKWSEVRNERLTPEMKKQVEANVEAAALKINLKNLRKQRNLTQEELAQQSNRRQSDISKIENREDLLISTIQRYVSDMGAKLEINAVFEDKTRVQLL